MLAEIIMSNLKSHKFWTRKRGKVGGYFERSQNVLKIGNNAQKKMRNLKLIILFSGNGLIYLGSYLNMNVVLVTTVLRAMRIFLSRTHVV